MWCGVISGIVWCGRWSDGDVGLGGGLMGMWVWEVV